jgi:hypothetical protein
MSDDIDVNAHLESFRVEYEGGGKSALLGVVIFCYHYRVLIPYWAGDALTYVMFKGGAGDLASWDAAFGTPWGTEQRRRAQTESNRQRVTAGGKTVVAKLWRPIGRFLNNWRRFIFAKTKMAPPAPSNVAARSTRRTART